MTQEQGGVMVYRDSDGSLYVRIPEDQKAAIEAVLDEQDSAGFLTGSDGGVGDFQVGRLTPIGFIPLLQHRGPFQNSLQARGIIIVGG